MKEKEVQQQRGTALLCFLLGILFYGTTWNNFLLSILDLLKVNTEQLAGVKSQLLKLLIKYQLVRIGVHAQ